MRKGILKTLLIIIFLTTSAICAVNYSAQLSNIENNFFGIDYPKDTDLIRLQRIEKVLYGSEQKGTVDSRIKKIAQDTGTTFENKKAQTPLPTNKNGSLDVPINPQNVQQPKAEEYVAEDSTVDYPIVDKLEEKVFNKTYKNEKIYKRLDRLETKVFNSTSKEELNTRVERLSDALLYNEKTAKQDNSGYLPYPEQAKKIPGKYQNYNNSQTGTYSDDNLSVQLANLEKATFNQVYIHDSISQRLNRLEQQTLGKTFAQDSPQVRVERLTTVNVAQKSSSMYDNNKTMRNVATFSQIGGILLMILALVL